MKTAAEQIRANREGMGWTQAELAKKARCSLRSVRRVEQGEPGGARVIPRLLKAMGMDATRDSGPGALNSPSLRQTSEPEGGQTKPMPPKEKGDPMEAR